MPEFTPTQQSILRVLDDGRPHTVPELLAAFVNEQTDKACLRVHMTYLRKKLEPNGQTIICEYRYKKFMYRWVRLLGNPYDGS